MFCKHTWKVIDKVEKRPIIESMRKMAPCDGDTLNTISTGTIVWLLQCDKCHKVKTIKRKF